MECVSLSQLNKKDKYYVTQYSLYLQTIKFTGTYMGSEIEWGSKSYLFKSYKYGYVNLSGYGLMIRKKTNARKKYLIKVFELILDQDFAIMNADYL